MSYSFGQFRRPQLNSYSTALTMEIVPLQQAGTDTGDVKFWNLIGKLVGDNILNSQNNYYLRFGLQQRADSDQIIYLKLKNYSEEEGFVEDNEQTVDRFKIPRGTGIVYFETIISPNATYNSIFWDLQRTAQDYNVKNGDGTYGRIMHIVRYTYARLVDILTVLNVPSSTQLTKIGIQGPPSLLMCINREQIRLGKTGIYEINNGINITSINFVPKASDGSLDGSDLDYFIMDFEY